MTSLTELLDTGGAQALLPLLDLAAGRAALRHVNAPVATVAFERLQVHCEPARADFVRVDAAVDATGASSVLVRLVAWRDDVSSRACVRLCTAWATFVAIDEHSRRPSRNVPPLRVVDPAGVRRRLFFTRLRHSLAQQRADCTEIDAVIAAVPRVPPGLEVESVPLDATMTALTKQFLPRNENFSGVVFGGDVLQTLAHFAIHTARRTTRGGVAAIVSIDRFTFQLPVNAKTELRANARATAAHGDIVSVAISATLDGRPSHEAAFSIRVSGGARICLDPSGASPEARAAFAQAITFERLIDIAEQDELFRTGEELARVNILSIEC